MTHPALALLEFGTIATGIVAGDAMVKRAPVAQLLAGTVQPGHFLVLVTGDVAAVEEAVAAGREIGRTDLRDTLFLPNVHPDVVHALANTRRPSDGDALGIVETTTVAGAIRAADAGLKGALVGLAQLRLGDGLGGKGLVLFTGRVTDVEAAVEIGCAVISGDGGQVVRSTVIAQLHDEMRANVDLSGRFGAHFGWEPA